MCSPVPKVWFKRHLVCIYRILLFTGLIHLKYDSAERRVRSPRFLRVLVQSSYSVLYVINGVVIFHNGFMLACYADIVLPQLRNSNIQTVLAASPLVLRAVTSFVLASNFLSRGHCLRLVANELLDIFDRLKTHTDSQMYFDRSLLFVALLKLLLTVVRVRYEAIIELRFRIIDVFLPYSFLLIVMTCLTCMYAQLVLLCFYLKINEHLAKISDSMDGHKLARLLRRFIAISNRLHRAKAKLDWFFSAFYATWYLGLLSDVYYTYDAFKGFVYMMRNMWWLYLIRFFTHFLPLCFMVSFDIYALGRLSDMLGDSATAFKRRVMELSDREDLRDHKSLQRAVELMAHQDWLRGAHTLAFENVPLSRKFALECVLGVIVVSVFACLNHYVGNGVDTEE